MNEIEFSCHKIPTHKSAKVSILIPVYNGANYLREAIDCALAQTYGDLEILVINDGSDDGGATEAIARSYGSRIRYFHKENGGVSSALNLGIKEMEGEYFSWLSHDDLYYPDKIERQIIYLQQNPHLQAVFSNSEIIDSMGTTRYVQRTAGPKVIRGPFTALQAWVFACALMVHRSCFETTGLFNENNRTTQDFEFILNLLYSYDVGHIQEVLVKRRDHEECGYHRLKELNLSEFDSLLQTVLKTKGITFFFPERESDRGNNAKAKMYELLGDYTAHAGTKFCRECYENSVRINPSIFNLSIYKKIMHQRLLHLFTRFSILARGSFYEM